MKQVFLVNGINKVYITTNPDNKASMRVCEKAGAKFVGLAELPENNDMRKDGDTHKIIFELRF